jgi:acyl-CoA reductase-like NAD-dependent aldehyde dehydrogenase
LEIEMQVMSTGSKTKRPKIPSSVTSFIDGESWTQDASVSTIPCISPADESVLTELHEADQDQVDAAVTAARRAFDSGAWPRLSVAERKRILLQIQQKIIEHSDELARLESVDAGLPLQGVALGQVPRAAINFEFFAEVISQGAGEAYTQTHPYLSYVTREPVGVGALIGPWNVSLGLCTMKIASCIAFGNTCVIKPSEYTPLSMRRFMELLHETDIPAGVVNLVNGSGQVTGDALVSHPDVDVVSFTGGTETARIIMRSAAEGLKPVAFELGGKSANIICASANLERALDGALCSIFSNNGEQCLAGSRVLVQRSIADEFIDKFVARAKNIRVGDPLNPETEIGPLCYEGHLNKVLSYVDIAREEGDELLTGGKRHADFERGYYFEPTAVLATGNKARVCQEEIFGPFASFIVFDDVDEAISIANDSSFGLVAYVWSEDLPTVMKVSKNVRAGTIWTNTPMTRELRAPFGGYKSSGIGRDSARDCMEFFTEAKTTTLPTEDFSFQRFGTQES